MPEYAAAMRNLKRADTQEIFMAESISLKLTGAPVAHPSLPSALRSALRGVDADAATQGPSMPAK